MFSSQTSRLSRYFKQILTNILVLMTKLSLIILICGLVSFAWAWFLFESRMVPELFYKAAVVLTAGISTGVLARIIFYKNKFLLAWLSAIVTMILSLWWLDGITGQLAGFNPILSFWMDEINWNGLWQLGLGMGLTWVVLSIWRSPGVRSQTIPLSFSSSQNESYPETVQMVVSPIRQKKQPRSSGIGKKASARVKKGKKGEPLINLGHAGDHGGSSMERKTLDLKNTKDQSMIKTGKKRSGHPSVSIYRSRTRGAGQPIKLVGSEEHRCPYCLDVVDPHDPAGVEVCSVCHTYHHKSCWDVTGTCQVPHIHE